MAANQQLLQDFLVLCPCPSSPLLSCHPQYKQLHPAKAFFPERSILNKHTLKMPISIALSWHKLCGPGGLWLSSPTYSKWIVSSLLNWGGNKNSAIVLFIQPLTAVLRQAKVTPRAFQIWNHGTNLPSNFFYLFHQTLGVTLCPGRTGRSVQSTTR